ncbi:EAL domain-containing protein [Clostridium chrysemydis]|uniref:EAL domain-containing protein n=1 Tax=Clostridium chrysemydis TaxID=2665504 RepID=UPI00188347B1|nr:EAL domain-containing protein [Clostridium chrysemydis]
MGANTIKNKRVKVLLILSLVISIIFFIFFKEAIDISKSRLLSEITSDYIERNLSEEDYLRIDKEAKSKDLNLDEEYFLNAYITYRKSSDKNICLKYFLLAEENFTDKTNDRIKIVSYLYLIDMLLEKEKIDDACFYIDKLFTVLNNDDLYYIYLNKIDHRLLKLADKSSRRIEALEYYREILNHSRSLSKFQKVLVNRRISILASSTSNYLECIENNMEILSQTENAKTDEDKYYLIKTIVDIATTIRKASGNYVSESIMEYADNFTLEDKALDSEVNIYRLINLAEGKLLSNDYDEMIKYLQEIDVYKEFINKNLKDDVECMQNIFYSAYYLDNSYIERATECINKAKYLIDNDKINRYVDKDIYYDISLGNILFYKKDYNGAIEEYSKAIKKSDKAGNIEMLNTSYSKVARVYNAIGDYKGEKETYKKLVSMEKDKGKVLSEDYYKYIIYREKNLKSIEHKLKDKIITLILCVLIGFLIIILLKLSIKPFIMKKIKRVRIKKYIKNKKYTLYYQPIINPKNNLVVSAEGLLRFKEKNNVLLPKELLKDIDDCNLMGDLTLYILKMAIDNYRVISRFEKLEEDFYLSINIRINELKNDSVFQRMIDIISESNLRRGAICLEITKCSEINNIDKVKANIKKLREVGFKIALDNFCIDEINGILIKSIEHDITKISVSILEAIFDSKYNCDMKELMQRIIYNKNINLIVEGVETKGENEFIKNLDLKNVYIQGYYYSEPLDIETLIKF